MTDFRSGERENYSWCNLLPFCSGIIAMNRVIADIHVSKAKVKFLFDIRKCFLICVIIFQEAMYT